jgi:hypothetical protein
MHRTQKMANDPTAKVGISENAAACKQNIAKNTARPPILSERAGHRRRPTASDTEMIIMKAAARAAEAPPMEPAITLASERMARPVVVLRKNPAQRAYSCQVLRASRRLQAPPPFSWLFDPGESPERPNSPGEYLTNQAAPPMMVA